VGDLSLSKRLSLPSWTFSESSTTSSGIRPITQTQAMCGLCFNHGSPPFRRCFPCSIRPWRAASKLEAISYHATSWNQLQPIPVVGSNAIVSYPHLSPVKESVLPQHARCQLPPTPTYCSIKALEGSSSLLKEKGAYDLQCMDGSKTVNQ
jgi:hypothetical protein